MPELYNSKRSMERATYTPVELRQGREGSKDGPRRAWDKWSYAANLAVKPREIATVAARMRKEGAVGAADKQVLEVFQKVWGHASEVPEQALALRSAPLFAPLGVEALARFGEVLADVRQTEADQVHQLHEGLHTAYLKAQPAPDRGPVLETQPPKGFTLVAHASSAAFPGSRIYQRIETLELGKLTAAKARTAKVAPARGTLGLQTKGSALLIQGPTAPEPRPPAAAPVPLALQAMFAWGRHEKAHQVAASQLLAHVEGLGLSPAATYEQVAQVTQAQLKGTRDAAFGFLKRMGVEPVGYLHLERLSFIPAGIERGELSYSVPLSPAEQVNISHKEWSNTSEEFEKIVTDYIESYSEEGVTEKSELTQSTNSQDQHSMGFNTGVTASGGYGPVTITASASLSLTQSSSHSEQSARNHSNTLTRKASARTKKEHKMSFKVASASGTEDQAVRLIKNPFDDKAVRVDYYQLIRKWRVDLYRYGVRLTYDLTLPEPGSDILSKILEIQALQAALSQGFNAPASTLPWAKFTLQPNQISRANYLTYAAEYGVAVDPPPVASYPIVRSFTHQWVDKDQAKHDEYNSFQIDVPADYQVNGVSWNWQRWAWTDESWHFDIRTDMNTWLGASGALTLTVGTRYVSAFDIELDITLGLTDAAYTAWKLKVWGDLHDAAVARYEENRAMLKNQLENLQNALGAQDALSLRKLEREEVMKNVLRWMFGPSFAFVPPGLPANLYTSGGSVVSPAVWNKVLAQGEVIKFLHHAIEWENMLYFLYPYFWSHSSRWEFKKYLDHPDFMHRTFLKAGSARVVLTIRPGFEKDFVSFLETGTFNGLPAGHPYLTIAEEIQAFAQTNYPGIRPANPVNDARPLLSPRQKKAWTDMQIVMTRLEAYKTANGAYPTTAQGLGVLTGVFPPKDPWGNPWSYASPGLSTDYELASLGADGVAGGEDENADVNSWAEASLIGRWYEYTPTSALDIAFAEILPTA